MKKIVATFLNPVIAVVNVLDSKGVLAKEEVAAEIKRLEEKDEEEI
ncbi:hypothetical protein [Bacillus sp. AG4(2022)]|nr:hypothetical protein [Bacillus sp. AG4(2022)]MDT0163832.1 hypothetical protein [Bacillus sp. AG4(2022)]